MKTEKQSLAFKILCDAEWLTGYPISLCEMLVSEGRLVHLNIGQWAQAEGDDRSGLFVVIDGVLQSYYAPINDRFIMLGFAEPGSVIGHATRYSGGPRLVTAVCTQPSIILEISENALDRVAADCPEIWRAIAGFTYNSMRDALGLVAEVISLKPRERIASRLLVIAKVGQSNENYIVKVSQELLGEMTGVTRKTVNFYLSEFEDSGLINIGYGQIELCDIAGLRAITRGAVKK